jgi:hypothetical protein
MQKTLSIIVCALLVGSSHLALATTKPNSSPEILCDRSCLNTVVDDYLEAMVNHAPSRASWAKHVLFTETGVALAIGDGLWGTISAVRDYGLRFADPQSGQVAAFEVVEEHGRAAILALRIRVEGRQIAEVETVLSRKIDNMPFPEISGMVVPDPIWNASVAPSDRVPRARMVSLADGHFDTLQLNDGKLFTHFHDDCNRKENGLQTTNHELPNYDIAQYGCAKQFELGQYLYDTELRERRYPLVDEEKGVVLAAGFIDHAGTVTEFEWTDGTPRKSMFFYPHSFIFLEAFKILDGKIRQVEAVFSHAPYKMTTPWAD